MNRIAFLAVACAALVLCVCEDAEARTPNVVFIIADDLGYGDLGCYGQEKIRTPSVDRMAAEGMRFTQHYCGSPVCAPSRSVLMTGQHPGHTFIRSNRGMPGGKMVNGRPEREGQFPIPAETVTLAEVMKGIGYVTGGFGKWGLGGPESTGAPLKQGFDRWFGYNCQAVAHNFYPTYLWDDDKVIALDNPEFPAHDRLKPGDEPDDPASYELFQGKEYSADLIGEQALEFIRANREDPFFLYWPTTVPHLALQVPDDSLEEYVGKWDDPPYPGGKGYLPHFKPKAAYAAMITRMDRDIGRAMDLVAELGLDEETIFVFTSDNGPLHGTHEGLGGTDSLFFNSHGGLRDGKGAIYEGGVRVPCVVRWKGKVKAGTVSDRVTGFEDWMPTLVELAGGDLKKEVPEGTDGISFAPTLLGKEQPARDFLYREFAGYEGQQAAWSGDWKAVRRNLSPGKGKEPVVKTELYHLKIDATESTDVAKEHPEVLAELEKIMEREHVTSPHFPIQALDGK